ncbi:MAG: hypothetical protein CMJ78_27770 [Planctomycetaceae bacterium]|nr:hypothetical protein [Planctomycetaceae bacterium]
MPIDAKVFGLIMTPSLLAWIVFIYRKRRGQSFLPMEPQIAASWNLFTPTLAAFWLSLNLVSIIATWVLPSSVNAEAKPVPSLQSLQTMCFLKSFWLVILIPALCSLDATKLRDFGIRRTQLARQTIDGVFAFLLSLLPVYAVLLATASLRSPDSEHEFLQLLRADNRVEVIAWLALGAVILAPMAEELIFRVILQGWLSTRLPVWLSIGITSLAFSMIHGFPDMLPLLPLSIMLGYVFHRRNSYWATVFAHALFNLQNVVLTLVSENQ